MTLGMLGVLLLLGGCDDGGPFSGGPAAPTIREVNYPGNPREYVGFPIRFQMEGWSGNPDDPDDIEVWAEFTLPDGSTEARPGFFRKGFAIDQSAQTITANGDDGWTVRYTARQTGAHSFVVRARNEHGTTASRAYEISVGPSPPGAKGFVVRSGNNHYWEWSRTGESAWLCGTNIKPETTDKPNSDYYNHSRVGRGDDTPGAYTPGEVYEVYAECMAWLDELIEHGGNAVRIRADAWWLCVEPESDSAEWRDAGFAIGAYDQRNSFIIDKIFEKAEQHDVAVQICHWCGNQSPYNDQYAKDKDETLVKRRLRHTTARWGASTSFWSYQYWNENGPTGNAFWQDTITPWLRALDVYDHDISSTGHWREYHDPWSDFQDRHIYMRDDANFFTRDTGFKTTAFPYCRGEYDFNYEGSGFAYNPTSVDPEGFCQHEGMWYFLMTRQASGLIWFMEHTIANQNGRTVFGAIQRYLDGEDMDRSWADARFTRVAGPGGLETVGMVGDGRHGLVWLVRTTSNDWDGVRPPANGNVYDVEDFSSGTYDVQWWDTWSGGVLSTQRGVRAANGKVRLHVPDGVARDIAAKIVKADLTKE